MSFFVSFISLNIGQDNIGIGFRPKRSGLITLIIMRIIKKIKIRIEVNKDQIRIKLTKN